MILDTELSARDWQALIADFKAKVEKSKPNHFPKIRWSSSGARLAPCSESCDKSARGRIPAAA